MPESDPPEFLGLDSSRRPLSPAEDFEPRARRFLEAERKLPLGPKSAVPPPQKKRGSRP